VRRRYHKAVNGLPFHIRGARKVYRYIDKCCRCGLIHHNRIKVLSEGKLEYTTWRKNSPRQRKPKPT
jgi:hypothetical protein